MYTLSTPSTNDYPEIVELWEASVRATHHFIPTEYIESMRPMVNKYLALVRLRCLKNEEDQIIGFSGTAEGNLEMLFIHPAYFGKGAGRHLIQKAIREDQVTKVDVNEQNVQALQFYLRMGFKVKSRSELDGQGQPYPILHMELTSSIE